ncbi:MAG: hypothetical protein PHY09_04285 [Desulfuromonadaceae bacterium]|nr:hypothetical protein [Desulfuromonadaceae bacterium]MDD5105737.1 hypothetical protein [Desulfuromonadaceae bacterium]
MKKILSLVTVALVALSFAAHVMAEEKKAEAMPAAEKAEMKDVKKDTKKAKKAAKKGEKKKEEAKPAAKGKKEVSGC